MTKALKWVLGGVLGCFGLIILATIVSILVVASQEYNKDLVKEAVVEEKVEQKVETTDEDFTEFFRKEDFVDGCVGEDKRQTNFCECAYTELERTMGLKEMARMGLKIMDEGNEALLDSPKVMDALTVCMPKYII